MQSISHTQFLVWHEWLRRQWNKPNRTDHYLMQLDRDMINLVAKRPVQLSERKIEWEWKTEETKSQSNLEAAKSFELQVMACIGMLPNG